MDAITKRSPTIEPAEEAGPRGGDRWSDGPVHQGQSVLAHHLRLARLRDGARPADDIASWNSCL